MTLETRYDNDPQEYVATIVGATSVPETARFATADAFRFWLLAFEREIAAQNWKPDGPPRIVTDGWPDKLPPR